MQPVQRFEIQKFWFPSKRKFCAGTALLQIWSLKGTFLFAIVGYFIVENTFAVARPCCCRTDFMDWGRLSIQYKHPKTIQTEWEIEKGEANGEVMDLWRIRSTYLDDWETWSHISIALSWVSTKSTMMSLIRKPQTHLKGCWTSRDILVTLTSSLKIPLETKDEMGWRSTFRNFQVNQS